MSVHIQAKIMERTRCTLNEINVPVSVKLSIEPFER